MILLNRLCNKKNEIHPLQVTPGQERDLESGLATPQSQPAQLQSAQFKSAQSALMKLR